MVLVMTLMFLGAFEGWSDLGVAEADCVYHIVCFFEILTKCIRSFFCLLYA